MNSSSLLARSALSAALAGALALAISILCFTALADVAMGTALVFGLGIGAVTFAFAWAATFFTLRARQGRSGRSPQA